LFSGAPSASKNCIRIPGSNIKIIPTNLLSRPTELIGSVRTATIPENNPG